MIEAVGCQPERGAVGARGHQADVSVPGAGLGRCGRVVVDTDEDATLLREPCGAVAEAASEVEERAVAGAGPHLAIARRVQREQRIGRLSFDRTFTCQFHGDSSSVSAADLP